MGLDVKTFKTQINQGDRITCSSKYQIFLRRNRFDYFGALGKIQIIHTHCNWLSLQASENGDEEEGQEHLQIFPEFICAGRENATAHCMQQNADSEGQTTTTACRLLPAPRKQICARYSCDHVSLGCTTVSQRVSHVQQHRMSKR